jgi:protein-disulfide isomerase
MNPIMEGVLDMKPSRFECGSVLFLALAALLGAAGEGMAQDRSPEAQAQEWRQAQVHRLALEGVSVQGPPQAPIQVVEYVDFLCGTCRQLAEAWKQVLPSTQGRVAVYLKNFPLDRACNETLKESPHPGSCWLALGEICAAELYEAEAYHEIAFAAHPDQPQAQEVVELAVQAGLERAAMERCLHSPQTNARLRAQIAEAAAAGVRGTPTLFVNGKRLPQLGDFAAWVKLEEQSLGLAQPGGGR